MADLKPLIKQRGSVKARVTVFTKYLNALKAIDKSLLLEKRSVNLS